MLALKKFNIGDRIRWFHYSHDMIVMNGGCGTVVDVEENPSPISLDLVYYVILKDGGQIEKFSQFDLDPLEWEEAGDEN